VDIGEEGIVFRRREEKPIAVELPTPSEAEAA
jgi:hypothetical protein